ncbi:MAG: hypothetical protein JXQ90_14070 [Cyclobacteriaceae bacterium]
MKTIHTLSLLLIGTIAFAQLNQNLFPVNVKYETTEYLGVNAVLVSPQSVNTEVKFVKLGNVKFANGTIDIDVAGKRAESAGQNARGFVGIAFRIADDNEQFECFYIRPTNGRAEDQLRRNHSVQYISFPDHPWHKLRKESPGKYESYADLEEGAWTHLKILVDGEKARLYVGNADQPTLLVNDLKLGANQSGSIGLWVGPGTEGYFANLKLSE